MPSLRLFGPARSCAGTGRIELPGASVAEVIDEAARRFGPAFTEIVDSSRLWVNGTAAGSRRPAHRPRRGRRPAAGVRWMTTPTPEGDPVRRLTHVDEHGRAHMVDVTGKSVTRRVAEARCSVRSVGDVPGVLARPPGGADLVETARIAGIMAAKRTPTLVPLCHPLLLDGIDVDVTVLDDGFAVRASRQLPTAPAWRWRRSLPAPRRPSSWSRHSSRSTPAPRWRTSPSGTSRVVVRACGTARPVGGPSRPENLAEAIQE